MKIAFVYDRVYPYHLGGGEKRAWELARALAASGHETSLLTHQMWQGPPILIREGVRLIGISQNHPPKTAPHQRSVGLIFRFAWGLARHLRKHSYDVVECANFPYLHCLVAAMTSRFHPFTLVVCWFEVRGWRGWWKHRRWLGLLAAVIELLVPRLIRNHSAISHRTRQRMVSFLGMKTEKIEVVACGANIRFISQFVTPSKLPQLVTAGRLVPHKRVDRAIRVLHQLLPTLPELTLLIIGEGPERETLESLAGSLNLSDRVSFVSRLSEEELYQSYARSLIFLFPSEMEGFGIVAIEAMAAGTPVVVQISPHSAAGELIENQQNGLLASSLQDWVEGTRRLLTDGVLYEAIRTRGIQGAAKYDWTVLAKETERYFARL